MPPRGRGQYYIQGQLKELKNVSIPDKVKCSRCHKYKNHSNYSEKQLNEVRHAIKYKNQSTGWVVKCVACSGGPLVEIECAVCRVTKGLEEFAKSQRKKPDEAECFKCTDKRLAVDAIDDEAYEHKDRARAFAQNTSGWVPTVWGKTDASDTAEKWETNSAADSEPGGIDLAEAFDNQMSFSCASNSGTLIDTSNKQTDDEDGWQTPHGTSWHTQSGPTSSSGFDPNKYGNPNASRSVSISRQSFDSSVAERSEPVNKGGWAKIRAYDPKKDPHAVVKQPVEEWSSDESDSDNDDDCGDDDEEI